MEIRNDNSSDAVIDPALLNSATKPPQFFYARHMQPGTAAYENETILVDTDAIKKMLPSAKGMPVFIHHQSNVPQEEVKEKAAGYVTRSFYNELDGWAWFEIMLIDDDAVASARKGWSVSNAYIPSTFGPAGTKNNVPFQREVLDGKFTHLALVPNPRYENACIMTPEQFAAYQDELRAKLKELTNSNPSKGHTMLLKFLRNKTEEVTNQADATDVEYQGKKMTVAEFQELMNGKPKKNDDDDAKAKAEAEAEEKENSQECLVDGIKMTVGQLKNAARAMKKNEADEMERKDNEKKNAEKKNAEDEEKRKAEEKKNAEEKAKKDEEEKKNGKANFDMLLNAHVNGARTQDAPVSETVSSGIARGKARYGAEAINK